MKKKVESQGNSKDDKRVNDRVQMLHKRPPGEQFVQANPRLLQMLSGLSNGWMISINRHYIMPNITREGGLVNYGTLFLHVYVCNVSHVLLTNR